MKKIAALVTTFVLGISGAAMAAPGYDGFHGPANRPPVAQPYRPIAPRWVTLASGDSLLRGRDMIAVNSLARFSTLKLQASSGSTFIDKVVITFANGQKQTVSLSKTLSARSGGTTIDLSGNTRQITRIQVVGKGGLRSSYSVLAV